MRGEIGEAVRRSVAYLSSHQALDSVRRDPYWPKWDSPWWHMTLLWEMGLAERIPPGAIDSMRQVFSSHFLAFFPLRRQDLPPEVDTHRHVVCHCALGTMYQVLTACGVDVDQEIPWIRPWFFRYQLPDGGLNCDEAAYTKSTPKSSIVSTLPPLEAVLFSTKRAFTLEEKEFLDRGAEYLIAHRLHRSLRSGETIDPSWLELCFPRFYGYDVLRGLRFLARWAIARRKTLPAEMVDEAVAAVDGNRAADGIIPKRRPWMMEKTLVMDEQGGWSQGHPASAFPLLTEVSRTDLASFELTAQWELVRADLAQL